MGIVLGKLGTQRGHRVMLSFARDPQRLRDAAQSIGPAAHVGTPAEAAAFGEVVLLTVPWGAVDAALDALGPVSGRVVLSCVNPLKPDFSGLEIGLTTSGAEYVASRLAGARVVECLFLNADLLASGSLEFAGQRASIYYCGDDAAGKVLTARLIADLGADPVDAGPLSNARLLEPNGLLIVQLAYVLGLGGQIATQLLRR
jgi:8-hydroxy-5-deazaflavin:NADPH oxidoreductase